MLTSIRVFNYRSFKNFSAQNLKRVNLFIGANNCGKTTLLEAAEILASQGDPVAVLRSTFRRGERIPETDDEHRSASDITHLFNRHEFREGSKFVISGTNHSEVSVACEIGTRVGNEEDEQLLLELDDLPLKLTIRSTEPDQFISLPLSEDGGVSERARRRLVSHRDSFDFRPVQFITTAGVQNWTLRNLWNAITLTPEENQVLEILRIIQPDIERIGLIDSVRRGTFVDRGPSGIHIRLSGNPNRMPLGSLGEGSIRLLGLSLSLIRSAGGAVIIDEIDTGLHYSVMRNLWRMILETSKRLNIQVFATTHSQDCMRTLAQLQDEMPHAANDICVHRIEKNKDASIPYSAEELAVAVAHDMEIR